MEKMFQSVGKAPRVSFDRAAVVFDTATGRILHIHRVTVAREHHRDMDDSELHHRALEAARKFVGDKETAAADVLQIEPEELQRVLGEARSREGQMHVDVAGRRIASRDKSASTRQNRPPHGFAHLK